VSVILTTLEAEIRRIAVPSQLQQKVCETLSQKHSSPKRAGGEGPEFKPQYRKNKTKQKTT
jgi:hypothetical protein